MPLGGSIAAGSSSAPLDSASPGVFPSAISPNGLGGTPTELAGWTKEEMNTLSQLQGQFTNLRMRKLIDEGASSQVTTLPCSPPCSVVADACVRTTLPCSPPCIVVADACVRTAPFASLQ